MGYYGYSQVMATAVADRCEVRTLLIDVVHLNGFVAALSYAHVCAIVRYACNISASACWQHRSIRPSCNGLAECMRRSAAPHCAPTSAGAIPDARETCRAERRKRNGLRCVASRIASYYWPTVTKAAHAHSPTVALDFATYGFATVLFLCEPAPQAAVWS